MSPRVILATVVMTVGVLAAGPGQAFDCGSEAARLAEAWKARRPAASPGAGLTMDQARCVQDRLVQQIGRPVGYKVGLTSKAAQEVFKHDSPLAGVLAEGMLADSGAEVPAAFGARPVWEPDLLVVVKDPAIAQAKTPEEAAEHIESVIPFIELPDLVIAKGEPMTAPVLVAINVGARAGVKGKAVPMRASADFVAALAGMTVVARDGEGREISRLPGKAILGHPLNAVIWLSQELASRGQALKKGDVVSLGSFGAPQPVAAGQTVTVTYEGLPGAEPVSVTFR